MGHNVGVNWRMNTANFSETYEGRENVAVNVTTVTDPDLVPWSDLIDPWVSIPSVPYTPGVGLFEGAYYRTGGVYRPTDTCMMVGGLRYCRSVPSELVQRVASIREFLPEIPVGLDPVGRPKP